MGSGVEGTGSGIGSGIVSGTKSGADGSGTSRIRSGLPMFIANPLDVKVDGCYPKIKTIYEYIFYTIKDSLTQSIWLL